MSDKLIRKAVEIQLKAWADNRSTPIFFENTGNEANQTLYITVHQLPAKTITQSQDGAHRTYKGYFQLSVYTPPKTSLDEAQDILAELDALMSPYFEHNGLTIYIKPAYAVSGYVDGNMYLTPIHIPYHCEVL